MKIEDLFILGQGLASIDGHILVGIGNGRPSAMCVFWIKDAWLKFKTLHPYHNVPLAVLSF